MSTRGQAPAVTLKEAIVAGIAPDGGLYVPATLERRPDAWWAALRGKSFPDVAMAMACELFAGEFDDDTIMSLVRDALNFPVRVVELERGLGVVELFHGPTFAFKDFGARTLARLLALTLRQAQGHPERSRGVSERRVTAGNAARVEGLALTILVATSGDTGSAVADAFLGIAGTRVVVLYPEGQVSHVQEAQFTTLGQNVTAVAVQGTFDDCQRLAKDAFADAALQLRVRLTSANSISLGRLLPQMFYYAFAALQYKAETPLVISVPSGNFGNLVAGVMALKMGAPINGFTAPTTINDTVPRYFDTGRVEPRPSVATAANAMDVGNPSNLERLQWLFDGNLAAMRKVISTAAHRDSEVRGAIAELYDKYRYVADPHSAIGYLGAVEARRGSSPPCALFLATAHPAKFRDVVEPIIGKPVPLPEPLAEMLARRKEVQRIGPTLAELSKLL